LELAGGYCATEEEVRKLFERRQPTLHGLPRLQIDKMVKIENSGSLAAFVEGRSFDIDPIKALLVPSSFFSRAMGSLSGQSPPAATPPDSLLFHGCPEVAATNIQAEGLLKMDRARAGMLGVGLYGAPDPRKSKAYCGNVQHGNFLFLCRFNLSGAQHAGPSTSHRNTVFDEFCVYKEEHVVVLWMIKLK